jgi:hypothetical protein
VIRITKTIAMAATPKAEVNSTCILITSKTHEATTIIVAALIVKKTHVGRRR